MWLNNLAKVIDRLIVEPICDMFRFRIKIHIYLIIAVVCIENFNIRINVILESIIPFIQGILYGEFASLGKNRELERYDPMCNQRKLELRMAKKRQAP